MWPQYAIVFLKHKYIFSWAHTSRWKIAIEQKKSIQHERDVDMMDAFLIELNLCTGKQQQNHQHVHHVWCLFFVSFIHRSRSLSRCVYFTAKEKWIEKWLSVCWLTGWLLKSTFQTHSIAINHFEAFFWPFPSFFPLEHSRLSFSLLPHVHSFPEIIIEWNEILSVSPLLYVNEWVSVWWKK